MVFWKDIKINTFKPPWSTKNLVLKFFWIYLYEINLIEARNQWEFFANGFLKNMGNFHGYT